MSTIPSRCPNCNNKTQWKEKINPFTSGIPLGNGAIRFHLLSVRGLLAEPVKKKLGFYKIKYRCKNCGYEEIYPLPQ